MRGPLPLYAYNLYLEHTTLSPEPIQLVALAPGERITLTHTVSFSNEESAAPALVATGAAAAGGGVGGGSVAVGAAALLAAFGGVALWRRGRASLLSAQFGAALGAAPGHEGGEGEYPEAAYVSFVDHSK